MVLRLFFLFFQGGGQTRKWPAGSQTLPPQNGLKRDFPKKKKKNTPNHTVTAPSPRLQKRPQFFFFAFFLLFFPHFFPADAYKTLWYKSSVQKIRHWRPLPEFISCNSQVLGEVLGWFLLFFPFFRRISPQKSRSGRRIPGGPRGVMYRAVRRKPAVNG